MFLELSHTKLLIEIDAALDICDDLNYWSKVELEILGEKMVNCFKQLSGLIKSNSK